MLIRLGFSHMLHPRESWVASVSPEAQGADGYSNVNPDSFTKKRGTTRYIATLANIFQRHFVHFRVFSINYIYVMRFSKQHCELGLISFTFFSKQRKMKLEILCDMSVTSQEDSRAPIIN